MTDAERIEAAAKAFAEWDFSHVPELVRPHAADIKRGIELALRAGYPELHAEPPTHWLAPWEASEIVVATLQEACRLGTTEALSETFAKADWETLRKRLQAVPPAHLRTGEDKR